jgi:hypothetical protein
MDERLKRNLKTAGLTTISILTGLIYVFYQMLTIEPTQLNPLTLIGSALVAIICSLTIKQVMGESGFNIGYGSDEWKREEDKYNDSCGTANEYMDLADNFYAQEEIDKRRQYRRVALQGVRLRYIDWFDENGYYKGEQEKFDKLTRQQKKVVRKCIKVKIYILNLFSEYEIGMESYERKEQTDKMQRRKSLGKNAISAILISAFGVYFTFVFTNFDWGSFWASMIQVILWLGFGIMQMMNNYYFVVKDRVSILKRKKELIQKFINGCKEHKYDVNPYDVELMGTEPKTSV